MSPPDKINDLLESRVKGRALRVILVQWPEMLIFGLIFALSFSSTSFVLFYTLLTVTMVTPKCEIHLSPQLQRSCEMNSDPLCALMLCSALLCSCLLSAVCCLLSASHMYHHLFFRPAHNVAGILSQWAQFKHSH